MATKDIPVVQDRQEAKQLQNTKKLIEGLNASIGVLKGVLDDQRGLSEARDKKIDQLVIDVEVWEGNIRGEYKDANAEKQGKVHAVLHDAAKLTLDESPGAGFTYLNRFSYGNRVILNVGPGEDAHKVEKEFFDAQKRLDSFQHNVTKLTGKIRRQGAKNRLLARAGDVGYKSALDDTFEDLEELLNPENINAIRQYIIDLVVNENVVIAERRAKDMASAGIGAVRIAGYLEDYKIDFEPKPAEATARHTRNLNEYGKKYGFAATALEADNPELSQRLRDAAAAHAALSNADTMIIYQIYTTAWIDEIIPYIKNKDYAGYLNGAVRDEIEKMSEGDIIRKMNEMTKKLLVVYASIFEDQDLTNMDMTVRQVELLRMSVADLDEPARLRDSNPQWYRIYRNFEKAVKRGTMPAIEPAVPQTITYPPQPPSLALVESAVESESGDGEPAAASWTDATKSSDDANNVPMHG